MCGIAGIFSFAEPALAGRLIDRLTDAMAHRGPDGRGTWEDPARHLALGHRRLSILDLTETGRQPMATRDGRFVMIYNGEIYNFLEIRRELEAKGHVFTSETDSEVVLASFTEWDDACFDRFNGMWALAIWDTRNKTLTLSRDRFGVKPLYVLNCLPKILALASETQALRTTFPGSIALSKEYIANCIENPYYLEAINKTIYANITSVPAGGLLRVHSDGRVHSSLWWKSENHLGATDATFAEEADHLRHLFTDACRLRMRSDVQIETALSGGIDSSSVFGVCRKLLSSGGYHQRVGKLGKGYTLSLPGSSVDEARAAARNLPENHKHRIVSMDAGTFGPDLIRDAARADLIYSEPLIVDQVYRAMREDGCYVSLDGHGADEVFLGYPDMVQALSGPQRGKFEFTSRSAYAESVHARVRSTLSKARRLLWQISRGDKRGRWLYYTIPQVAVSEVQSRCIGRDVCFFEVHAGRLPTLLRNFDLASMRYGIEIRMPFMDYRVVTFGLSLAASRKVRDGLTKAHVRASMRGTVPDAILDDTGKIGVAAPLSDWLKETGTEFMRDMVRSKAFLTSDVWNGPRARDFVEDKFRTASWTRTDAQLIWRTLCAHLIMHSAV